MGFGAIGFGSSGEVGSSSSLRAAPAHRMPGFIPLQPGVGGAPVGDAALPDFNVDVVLGGFGTTNQTSNSFPGGRGDPRQRCRACCSVAWDRLDALGNRSYFCSKWTFPTTVLAQSCWIHTGASEDSWRNWCAHVSDDCDCW